MAKKANCKEVILDGAEAVVMEMGAVHMSLDVVARKAGVSKGGLMYHFPTKKSLLKAMIERLVAQFYTDRAEISDKVKQGPGQNLRAGILTALAPNEKRDRMGLSILVVAANDPELLKCLKEAHRVHMKEMADSGLDFERAAVISLASDGLMLSEMLGLSPYTPAQKKRLKDTMIRMIEELEAGKG
ncbi:MAG: TetR family transcriptional regulator [Candidatus Omnitrophica bacterium]|nr:TetR family transcriptional regulator [Candidatus Omnitrophota bacterium]